MIKVIQEESDRIVIGFSGKENTGERIEWIDCSKGICMFLVILGHTVSIAGNGLEKLLRGSIFSFHMPLFFILSCTTYNFSEDETQLNRNIRRSCRHLLIPALVIYVLRIATDVIGRFNTIEWKSYLRQIVNILVYSSGTDVTVERAVIPAFGMMWFLVALFIGRSLYDYLHMSLKAPLFGVLICICTISGIVLGHLQWLPLSMDIILAVMPLFYFGNILKTVDVDKRALSFCFVFFTIWSLTFAVTYFAFRDYLELAGRRYPLFPLCYITAISGTMFVAYFCNLISGFSVTKPIKFIGRYSLYLFCVHSMDFLWGMIWNISTNNIINGMIRIITDCLITLIIIKTSLMIQNWSQKRSCIFFRE